MNSASALAAYSLLACTHELLPRAFQVWLQCMHRNESPARLYEAAATNAFAFEDPLVVDEAEAAVPPNAQLEQSFNWVEWNQKQRRKTSDFLSLNPVHSLVTSTVTLGLAVRTLHIIERVASADYIVHQEWEALQGRPCNYRVTALCNDRLYRDVVLEAESLLTRAESYAALPALSRTWASLGLAFCLVSSSLGAMEFYLFKPWRGFPWCIFGLLSCQTQRERELFAEQILSKPTCLHDSWSGRFLQKYDSVALLTDRPCLTVLHGIATELKFDIVAVEYRHASVRRLQRNRAATHMADIADVSADFLLQSHRTAGLVIPSAVKEFGVCTQKKKKKKIVGGGAQRCYLSDALRRNHALEPERRLSKRAVFQLANANFRAMKARSGMEWRALLERGRKAHSWKKAGACLAKKRARAPAAGPLKKAKALLSKSDVEQRSVKEVLQASVVQKAEEELERATGFLQETLREQRSERRRRDSKLQDWREREWQRRKCGICPDVKRSISPQSSTVADLHFNVETFKAPVQDYLRHFMSVPNNELHQKLQDAWCLKHVPFRHAMAPSVKLHPKYPPLAATTPCGRAGQCLCGANKYGHRLLVKNVATFVRALFDKKAQSKVLLDARRAVLCLRSVREGDCRYFHIAYTNRKQGEFILLELQRSTLIPTLKVPAQSTLLCRSDMLTHSMT